MPTANLPQKRHEPIPAPQPVWTHPTQQTVIAVIAERYRVSPEYAAVIVRLAGLGSREDRR